MARHAAAVAGDGGRRAEAYPGHRAERGRDARIDPPLRTGRREGVHRQAGVASVLLDTLADIATTGQAQVPVQTWDLIELGTAEDGAFDPEVLEELAAVGMGSDFVTRFIEQDRRRTA